MENLWVIGLLLLALEGADSILRKIRKMLKKSRGEKRRVEEEDVDAGNDECDGCTGIS